MEAVSEHHRHKMHQLLNQCFWFTVCCCCNNFLWYNTALLGTLLRSNCRKWIETKYVFIGSKTLIGTVHTFILQWVFFVHFNYKFVTFLSQSFRVTVAQEVKQVVYDQCEFWLWHKITFHQTSHYLETWAWADLQDIVGMFREEEKSHLVSKKQTLFQFQHKSPHRWNDTLFFISVKLFFKRQVVV